MSCKNIKSVNSIAIVDDEPLIRSVVARFCGLAFPDTKITKFENGEQGEISAKNSDVIWTDQIMPKKSGLAMLHSLLDSGQIDYTRQRLILWSGKLEKGDINDIVYLYRQGILRCFSAKGSSDGIDPIHGIIQMITKEISGDKSGAESLSRELFVQANRNLGGIYDQNKLQRIFEDRGKTILN